MNGIEEKTGVSADLSVSWYEISARERVRLLLDPDSFVEFIGPEQREVSPHLALFDLPEQFDDGIIVGQGTLNGTTVLIAAQEGRFMGGAFGEVHGAKLTGLLRAAGERKSVPVLILFDTGGVRLQEANAGELAISEIMRAMIAARLAGANIIGLIGGRAGCYGGGGLISACCSALAISEQGRIAVSGPEVIETNRGVEEFDSRDRALVWRTMGGKHRRLLGAAEIYADGSVQSFREAALKLVDIPTGFGMETLRAEQQRLEDRLSTFGDCADGIDVWRKMGIALPETVPDTSAGQFTLLAAQYGRESHDAR
ncbi:biotin-independent malonate decarboxylase subunit beta [Martelella soudanensis]|uniref:biotin-independent malonate decarboxylase subunit beta n=1 Tax=unclassified Martelella TaxID=2629616 RepID=UPI0015DD6B99|nr:MULTISPECIES: biotin-independent malonate decarboxylase subunit beta [unclassified Martelella]